MSVRSKVKGTAVDNSVRPYVLPWLSIPAVLIVGQCAHVSLVQGETFWTVVLSGLVLVLLFGGLSATVYGYAKARGQIVLVHASATVLVHGALLLSILLSGVSWGLFWLTLAVLSTLALSWNARRYGAIRGEGDGQDNGGEDKFGLSIKRTKVLEKAPERARARWTLGGGQTLESVQPKLLALGSELGTIRKGMRVIPTDREGVVEVTAIYRDVLKETKPWAGPSHPGGSIADGVNWGDYEDTEPVWMYLAGNYEKNVAPGHTALTGMTRSGKGVCMHVTAAELSTRRDVSKFVVLDERKGRQTTDNIDAAIGYYADTAPKIRAALRGLDNAVAARAKALGEHGYKSWTPECAADPRLRMGALIIFGEEASTYANTCGDTLVKILEAGLSAGVFAFLSAQLWKHDRVPTSLRSQIANVIAYGLGSTEDASYLLGDETIANGADPGAWGTRFPGRFACELNGVAPERFGIQAKGYLAEDEELQAVTDEWGPKMLPYDPWTLAALGTAYEPYQMRRTPSGIVVPVGVSLSVARAAKEEFSQLTNRMTELDDRDIDRECDEDTRPIPEEEDGMYGVPEMDDEELAAMAAAIDLEQPLPEYNGADVDLEPEPTQGARMWTASEKRAAFAAMMLRLAQAPGGMAREYKTSELYDAWIAELGCEREAMRPERLHDLLNEAREAGQMEPLMRGRWRIVTLVEPLPSVTDSRSA